MPNRIIREGWLESERINQLDANAERFFLRLCLRADDFGRYHANPLLLRSNLFPLREDVRSTDIPRWLAACEKAGLLRCYEVTGTRYLEVTKFNQRMRAAVSKFPKPPDNDGQMTVTCQTEDRPPRTEAETSSEAEAEAEKETTSPPPTTPSAPSDGERFVSWFLALLKETGAEPKLTPSVRENWADCYDKLLRIDGRTKDQVKEVCRWARNDAFWAKNFLSPMKLRQKNDGGIAYFDVFTARMADDRKPKTGNDTGGFNFVDHTKANNQP
jgi:hypothetical protein